MTPEDNTARPEERSRGFRFTLLREVKRILACRFHLVFLLVLPILGFAAMLLIFHRAPARLAWTCC